MPAAELTKDENIGSYYNFYGYLLDKFCQQLTASNLLPATYCQQLTDLNLYCQSWYIHSRTFIPNISLWTTSCFVKIYSYFTYVELYFCILLNPLDTVINSPNCGVHNVNVYIFFVSWHYRTISFNKTWNRHFLHPKVKMKLFFALIKIGFGFALPPYSALSKLITNFQTLVKSCLIKESIL